MRNLLRCRRGSAAFATVAALVPLIGVVALGAEAGSWYVTKQHAQNAADAAAYSGALRVACSIPGIVIVIQHKTMSIVANNLPHGMGSATLATVVSGLQLCPSLPTGTTQTVQIDQPTAVRVRAIVSQQQPAYLARVLGLFPGGSTSALKPSPKSRTRKTYVFWDLAVVTDLQSAAVAP